METIQNNIGILVFDQVETTGPNDPSFRYDIAWSRCFVTHCYQAETGENEKRGSRSIPKPFPKYKKRGGENARKRETEEQGLDQKPTQRRVHR